MHSEVFYNSKVTVATCIVIIRAKEKHPIEYKTYFAMWQNDGFIKIKKIGRTDFNNNWESIKSNWVKHYQNKEEIIGYSIKEVVDLKTQHLVYILKFCSLLSCQSSHL